MTIRKLNLNELKTILTDPTKALAVCHLSDSEYITTNNPDQKPVKIIEEVITNTDVHAILSEWIDKGTVDYNYKEFDDYRLSTSQYCENLREA